MPSLFNRQFYDKIANRVWLDDCFHNEIEVKIRRRKGQMFLTDGCRQVGRVYNLREGGYLKLFFHNRYEFVIDTMMDRWMVEVRYPKTPVWCPLGVESSSIEVEDDEVVVDEASVENVVEGESVEPVGDGANFGTGIVDEIDHANGTLTMLIISFLRRD